MRNILLLGAAALGLAAAAEAQTPVRGGVITVATIGEPPTLDPMQSTADLVGMITQHIHETLFTFGEGWRIAPLLAQSVPTPSADGLVYDIALREGVSFHDGSALDSADVVASLRRWMEVASRGRLAAAAIQSVEATGPHAVRITLSRPFAPLLSLLAFNNSAAVIMPAELVAGGGDAVVGAGPYRLQARVADQYIQLVRHEGYVPRDEPQSFYGGARNGYADEIRFVPVPNAATRLEGAVAGQFHYTDSLPVEQEARLAGSASEPVLLAPFGWPVFVMNMADGPLADIRARRAVQASLNPGDMLAAAFGSEAFFKVDGALYPEGWPWRSDVGVEVYNQVDFDRAKALLGEAGYDGRPIRILTSRQYEFHYNMALVAAEYLRMGGFAVALDVVDWATLTQRRQDPKLFDIFITHSPFLPEPALTGAFAKGAPGFWETATKYAAVDAFNAALTQEARVAAFAEVQRVVMEEAPYIKIGEFNALSARAPALQGMEKAPWPFFWNAWLAE